MPLDFDPFDFSEPDPPADPVADAAFRLRCLDFCIASKEQVPWHEDDPAPRLKILAELRAKRAALAGGG